MLRYINPYVKFQIFVFLVLVIFVSGFSIVSAVECGNVPTDNCVVNYNTTFDTGIYTLTNGIKINSSNILLDCNGSTLRSGASGYSGTTGINFQSKDFVTIKNCIIESYGTGASLRTTGVPCISENPSSNCLLENLTINSTVGINIEGSYLCTALITSNKVINSTILAGGTVGVNLTYVKENVLEGNVFRSSIGVSISDATSVTGPVSNNNITNNFFINNSLASISAGDLTNSNNIWNNTVNSNITYKATSNNYCIDNIGNTYLDGADGPTCECMPLINRLHVTSTRSFCVRNYTLPNGLSFRSNDVTLDCNGSIIYSGGAGYSSTIGVDFSGYDNLEVKNCEIVGYKYGINIDTAGAPCSGLNPSTNSLIENNTFNSSVGIYGDGGLVVPSCGGQNTYATIENNIFLEGLSTGIQLDLVHFNNISNNVFLSSKGVNISSISKKNLIIENNFIAAQSFDYGVNNAWNSTFGGNYWSDYDSAGEGCSNTDHDLFCDIPKNISGSSNNKDYLPFVIENGWLYGLHISDLMPVQVVEGVDLVNGKRTLIRVSAGFLSLNSSESINSSLALYWNGTLIATNNTLILNSNQSRNVDFWYTPQFADSNIPITVIINGTTSLNVSYSDSKTDLVNVFNTRNLSLAFISVDNPQNFEYIALKNLEFIRKLYPLKESGIQYALNRTNINSNISSGSDSALYALLIRIHKSTLISGKLPERSVGIVPEGWFSSHTGDNEAIGVSMPFNSGVLIEEQAGLYDHGAAHEIGHTYGLCDEYSSSTWLSESIRNIILLQGRCINGDLDEDLSLDSECITEGCPTFTLEPISGKPDNISLHNIMGNGVSDNAWVATDTYNLLLDEFKHASPVFASKRIVVSGIINKSANYSIKLDSFYKIDGGLAINRSEFTRGNYSLQAFTSGGSLAYNISFDVSFLNMFFGGNATESNESAFVFTIPFEENYSSFVVRRNNILKDIKNVSSGTPVINLTSALGERVFSNEKINVTWSSSDNDGDYLVYAVLISADNGTTYNALDYDLNTSSYLINSLDLVDSSQYLIKVLASDGINTNYTVTNSTFEVDNDLQIKYLDAVYQNNTQRVFRIELNNTLNTTLSNLSWEFNTGETVENCSTPFTLESGEDIFFFIYHNYSQSGNYNYSFKAFSGNYIENEFKQITI